MILGYLLDVDSLRNAKISLLLPVESLSSRELWHLSLLRKYARFQAKAWPPIDEAMPLLS
jgi:hypothetical protein